MPKRGVLGTGSSGTGWLQVFGERQPPPAPGGCLSCWGPPQRHLCGVPHQEQSSSWGCSWHQGWCERLSETARDHRLLRPGSNSLQLSTSAQPGAAKAQHRASPCTAHKAPRAVEKCKEKGHPQLKSYQKKKILRNFSDPTFDPNLPAKFLCCHNPFLGLFFFSPPSSWSHVNVLQEQKEKLSYPGRALGTRQHGDTHLLKRL